MKKPRNWTCVTRHAVFEHPLFSLAKIELAPQQEEAGPTTVERSSHRQALVIESNDWVNVVAVNDSGPQDEILLIRQWRYGSAVQTLEIPGGLVDSGESPADAARRELLEETGYACDHLEKIGVVQPNPALFNNLCHVFLARGLSKQTEDATGDGDEEIEVLVCALENMPDLIRSGTIQHALVIAAMHFYSLFEANPKNTKE